jgi:hypothetical protein
VVKGREVMKPFFDFSNTGSCEEVIRRFFEHDIVNNSITIDKRRNILYWYHSHFVLEGALDALSLRYLFFLFFMMICKFVVISLSILLLN